MECIGWTLERQKACQRWRHIPAHQPCHKEYQCNQPLEQKITYHLSDNYCIIHIGPVIRRCIPGYLLSDYSHSSDTCFRMGYIQFPLSQQYKNRRTAACYCYFPLQPYASLGNPWTDHRYRFYFVYGCIFLFLPGSMATRHRNDRFLFRDMGNRHYHSSLDIS